MSATKITTARLRVWGMPVWSIDAGKIAVWNSDDITILTRVGSHYFCRVEYGPWESPATFHVWIHKRLLSRRDRREAVAA